MFAADAQASKRFRECEKRLGDLEKEALKMGQALVKSKNGMILSD